MPVVITSKTRYSGTVTPQALNTETVVVEIGAQNDDYMVEGWIDLSALTSEDFVELREYVAVDGVNYRLFMPPTTYNGPLEAPVIRFHSKQFLYDMKYKLTIIQKAGTLRSFPYRLLLEVMGSI
jgi:hypothetical protein